MLIVFEVAPALVREGSTSIVATEILYLISPFLFSQNHDILVDQTLLESRCLPHEAFYYRDVPFVSTYRRRCLRRIFSARVI